MSMRKSKAKIVLNGLMIHSILSGMLAGMMHVYQQCYNTTHREQIQTASVVIQGKQAEVQILHQKFEIELLSENSVMYYIAYLLTDTPLHSWVFLYDFIK